jgi:murein DD-endopeptidase MepM/ murein hydrolase activator NlpD
VLKTPGGVRYAVARGDTLYGIAQRFGVEVAELRLVNGLGSDNAIDAGERLVLPRTDAPERLRTASSQSGSPAASADGPASPEPRPVLKAERRAAPPPPPRSSETFDWPVTGPLLAEFGETADGLQNDGIKIGVPAGTPVRAAESGVVVYAGDDLVGLGKLVLVQHGDGWLTAYAHLDRIDVGDGAQIGRGDTIGLAGATGSVGSAQLHFETRRGERPVNPLEHLPPRTV